MEKRQQCSHEWNGRKWRVLLLQSHSNPWNHNLKRLQGLSNSLNPHTVKYTHNKINGNCVILSVRLLPCSATSKVKRGEGFLLAKSLAFLRSHLLWKLGKSPGCRLQKSVGCVGTSAITPTTRRVSRVHWESPKSRKPKTKTNNKLITQETLTKTTASQARSQSPINRALRVGERGQFLSRKGICPVRCSLCWKGSL